MIWVDYVILAILGISMLVSLLRGFVREALSVVTWIAAGWVALAFSGRFSQLLEPYIQTPSARAVVAFAALFFATLLLGALINYLVGQLVQKTGLSGTDRVVGMLFGLARGIAIVAVLVLLAAPAKLPQDPWWKESTLIPHFQKVAIWMRGFLPPEYAKDFSYD